MDHCRDHERDWNDRLDARDPADLAPPRAAEGHASACPTCRALDVRYQAMSQAIRSLTPPPGPPSGFADRVLVAASAGRDRRGIAGRIVPWFGALAAAAAVVAALAIGLGVRKPEAVVESAPAPTAGVRAIDPKGLTEGLADAGSATWDLAREASAPAARVGRQVLVAAELPGAPPRVSMPEGVRPASDVWRDVEDRVSAGVGPLEGTARHAFGFLLDSPPDDDAPPPRPAEGA